MKRVIWILAGAVLAVGQDSDSIKVAFSDPARPKTVKASLVNACVEVTGYEGHEVVIDSSAIARARRTRRNVDGLRRIDLAPGITADEESNTVRIAGPLSGRIRLKVPSDAALKIDCLNGGDLRVDRMNGNLELNNHNGGVNVTGVTAPIVAHSHNGKVTVSFDKVPADKSMSVSSWNGDVDVTMPPDARATLKMSTHNGSLFTDFDLRISAGSTVGKDVTSGTINGGGPDVTLKTWNGSLMLRKRK